MTLRRAWIPVAAALCFLLAGLVLSNPRPDSARVLWTTGLVMVGLPLVARTAAGAVRGRFTADLVASLAIVTALVLGQPLAGLVVALMQSGGEALETLSARRASAALRALEDEAPQIAHLVRGASTIDVGAGSIAPDACNWAKVSASALASPAALSFGGPSELPARWDDCASGSAPCTAATLSVPVLMPCSDLRRSAAARVRVVATTRRRGWRCSSRPPRMAWPMVPAPRTAIVFLSSMASPACGLTVPQAGAPPAAGVSSAA